MSEEINNQAQSDDKQKPSSNLKKMLEHLRFSYHNFLNKMNKIEKEEKQASKEILEEIDEIKEEEIEERIKELD